MYCSSVVRQIAVLAAAATACLLAGAARSEGADDSHVKPVLPAEVSSCAAAVNRIVAGHAKFTQFVWDRDDPRKYIQSTMMPMVEFRGKMVPVDYRLILVGQLKQRGSGQMIDGNGVCGMRSGHIVTVTVAPSTN
jgi:hypothetical protein